MKEKKVRVFTSGSFDLFHIGHEYCGEVSLIG